MTNWLEDHLNAEKQQQQQESTLFNGESDASKQHQQTWPAITLEGVLRWEHHYRPCAAGEIKAGFVKKSLVVGVCCLLNQTAQWYTRKILSVFWPHETKQINRKKTRNRIKHGEAMIAQLMITLLSNRIEEECGSAWKVLSSWIKYNSLVENMMSEVLNHLFSRYVIATCPQRSQVLWRRLLSVWSSQWLTEHACVRTMRSPQNSVSPLQTSRGKCWAHYIHDFSPPGKTTSNQPIYPTHTQIIQ